MPRAAVKSCHRRIGGFLVLVAVCGASGWTASSARPSEFYASPDGTGDGRSVSSPFRVEKFWSKARPGATLWLLDGRYRGDASMLDPPPSVRGAAGNPVRVKALHDGKVLIDGEGARRPLFLRDNEHVSIEGVNACCSSMDVVYLSGTKHVELRRIVAWDAAPDQNAMVFSVAYGSDALLEDTAGFGSGRKIYQYFQTDGPATIRRAWGEWNRSVNKGPKMTFSLVYNSRNLTVENALGTWRSLMPESYTILDNGKPYKAGVWSDYNRSSSRCSPGVQQPDGTCLVSGGRIDQMYGVLTADAFSGRERNRRAQSRYLGSLAYVLPGVDTGQLPRLVFATQVESVTLENVAAYWPEPGPGKEAILLGNCDASKGQVPCGPGSPELLARGLTALGGVIRLSRSPQTQWKVDDIAEAASPSELYGSSGASVFAPAARGGASLCYRYQDGKLTKEPLWPWPMNDRIREATAEAGRDPVDVTKTIEKLFGSIPAPCRATAESAVQKP